MNSEKKAEATPVIVALAQQRSRKKGFRPGQTVAIPGEQLPVRIKEIKGEMVVVELSGGKERIESISEAYNPKIAAEIEQTEEWKLYDLLLSPQVCDECGRRMCDHEVTYKKELRLKKAS